MIHDMEAKLKENEGKLRKKEKNKMGGHLTGGLSPANKIKGASLCDKNRNKELEA